MISFNDIKALFNEDEWDVGVISDEGLLQCALSPVKYKYHFEGEDFTNNIFFNGVTNCIVLVRPGHTWDYTHYDEAQDILAKSNFKDWSLVYTNFKHAAILAGLGVRAKNSLIYSYKFGFDCHIAVIRFQETITDFPTNTRVNAKLWSRCNGCDDCANACPVGAINNKKEPYWINSTACANFCGYGDHPTIPSVKHFWHENVHPEAPKELVDQFKSDHSMHQLTGVILPFDKNGYMYDGQVVRKDGQPVHVPFCRECTSQPRCSKWDGKYPYDAIKKQDYKAIKFYSKGDIDEKYEV